MGKEVYRERVRHYTDEDGIRGICRSGWFPQSASDTGAGVYVTPLGSSLFNLFRSVVSSNNDGGETEATSGRADFYVEFDLHLQSNTKLVGDNVWQMNHDYLTLDGLKKEGTVSIGSTRCLGTIQDPAEVEELIEAAKRRRGLLVWGLFLEQKPRERVFQALIVGFLGLYLVIQLVINFPLIVLVPLFYFWWGNSS